MFERALFDGIILALLIIEVLELSHHMWRRQSYEQKIGLRMEEKESHIGMMDKELEKTKRTVKHG
jgi:hypothetical protein